MAAIGTDLARWLLSFLPLVGKELHAVAAYHVGDALQGAYGDVAAYHVGQRPAPDAHLLGHLFDGVAVPSDYFSDYHIILLFVSAAKVAKLSETAKRFQQKVIF